MFVVSEKVRTVTRRVAALAFIALLAGCLGSTGDTGSTGDAGGTGDTTDPTTPVLEGADAGEALFRRTCAGCHTFGHGDHLAPDLSKRNKQEGWTRQFLQDPAAFVGQTKHGEQLLDEWGYVMPNFRLSTTQIDDLLAFFNRQDELGPLPFTPPPDLSTDEFTQATRLYFDRCAGCHGLYRGGATGPKIVQDRAQWIGTDGLGALLRHGTPRGMPGFGDAGELGEPDIRLLTAFLQLPPPEPPQLPMSEIEASWHLLVPVDKRPTAPEHGYDWEDFFGVVERDAGKVSIYDGATRERIVRLDVGFAVHILRSSASGRYFYAIGRDGLVSLIDLWAKQPNIVATVKGCHDARSVETSRFAGQEDKYLVEGCYWPPQYVVFDGLTLEPLARNDLPMDSIEGKTLDEVRVASIVAPRGEPVWALALKESGYVAVVDYSQPGFPLTERIAAERFLHDGGWDRTGSYFLVAANASNKMVVIDIANRKKVESIDTGDTPHPGRGANWEDPEYGWVNATPHLGEPKVSIYGADPQGRPDVAWKVVREVTLPAAGSLFLKTHPNSPWVLFDMTLSASHARQVCAYSKASAKIERCFDVARNGKAVHFEFNRAGTQVWVSDWATDGAVIVLDGNTLDEVARIGDLISPTGKFNVYNTAHEVY
ncbi:MAG TPA: cytochrome D1 domain-containing protein [Burkholderiaceae bacterium]|nr:cytochrome D1 domain-containing protein [Burkholderiaceae bacterium]